MSDQIPYERWWVVAGAFLGAVIGFMIRPAFMGSQLPLDAVLSRGESLSGLSQIAVGTAQTSFNYLLVGLLLGSIAGYSLMQHFRHK